MRGPAPHPEYPLRLSLTRSLIIASAGAALVVQLWLASHSWAPLAWLAGAAFVIGMAGGRLGSAVACWTVIGLICLSPAPIRAYAGIQPASSAVVVAGALGLALGAQRSWQWCMPRAWALSLSFTALAVAFTWPVVAWRETDFVFRPPDATQAVTWLGIPPHVQIAFVAGTAAAHLVGIVFFDSLMGRFRDDLPGLRRLVLAPLVAAAGLSALVAVYQMAVDLPFLNSSFFAGLGRASGTMLDANVFGTVAAMCAPAAAWLLATSGTRILRALSPAAVVLFSAAVWATGSRTALLALLVGLSLLGLALIRHFWQRASVRGLGAVLALGILALGLTGAVVMRSQVVGPLARLSELESSGGSTRDLLKELRDRGGYGSTARTIIGEFPLTGTGVGTFHAMVTEYAMRLRDSSLAPDNAQNWFRHQVAELGWIGASGYFAWLALFVRFVVARWWRGEPDILAAGGALAGLLAASLLGVPTQEAGVLLTFWIFVAWVAIAAGAVPKPMTWGWTAATAAVVLVAVVYASGTAYLAADRLRVPQRAAETGWSYQYGLSPFELTEPGYIRWMTARRSVAVFERGGRYVLVRFEVRHPDSAERPVDVEVKMQGVTVLHTKLRSRGLVEAHLELKTDDPFIRLEFLVDHTFRDPVSGAERGLLLHPFTFESEAQSETWRFR